LLNVHTVLEEATKISATFYKGVVVNPSGLVCPPSVGVKFPDGQVIAVDRAYLWDEGGKVCLAMFPAELQIQYKQLYSDRAKVEALVALTNEAGWELQPNFHLAFHNAHPTQRWYPRRHLSGRNYVQQWIDDFRGGRTKARSREGLEDQSFRRWLMDRSYATEIDVATLDDWLYSKSPNIQFHIRPSVEVRRTWDLNDAVTRDGDGDGEFVAEVRHAIDGALSALGEPEIKDLWPQTARQEPSKRRKRQDSTAVARENVAATRPACPSCHMVHAGECL
jgi:hypothetical protein